MYDKEQLIDFMQLQFGVKVEKKAVGEETVLLYHEELDKKIISEDVMGTLPNPVLFQTYLYSEETEWVVGIAIEAKTNKPLFLVCLKGGEKVYEKLLSEGERLNE
ncbi:hypothetical protein PD280_07360 [Virgibacillus salarius]|uniref:hypothetical protein n=1 Tax=Virgibacillus salarius TaxID=447199 RepID=UPI00248F5298|nr:hypothetical protein [Virgibacillus salarius]WBX81509.1 hypothetical protein PD280_07360 [Virgibacillus salarius]